MEARRLLVLSVIMVIYLCVGAAVFNAMEGESEKGRKQDLEKDINLFLNNNTCVDRKVLHELLFKASRDGELVYYILNNKTHLDRWDFSGAFGFSISVVTTIGFGNLAPYTMEGKVMVVIYALMGIPLMLLLLAGIGEKLVLLFKRINKLSVCSTKPQVNRVVNMIFIIVLGLLVGFIAPATMFHFIEDWHFLEALYFCFTTLSTIGFGDYIIGIHEQRISEGALHELYEVVAYVWILFGLAYVSLVIKYISDLLIAKAQKMEQKTVRRLEGTSLFRKISGFMSSGVDISAPSSRKNSDSFSEEVPSPPYITRNLDESSPPTYSTVEVEQQNAAVVMIGRINGEREARKPQKPAATITNRKLNEPPVSAENDEKGVELLAVNYI